MTDLAARLRDVLTAKSFDQIVTDDPWTSELIEAPVDAIATALSPLLSSLLEEREREIRENLTLDLQDIASRLRMADQMVVRDPAKEFRDIADTVDELWQRLASSSSPGEEKSK